AVEDLLDVDPEAKEINREIRLYEKEIELYAKRGFKPNYVSVLAARDKIRLAKKQLAKRRTALLPKAKRMLAKMPGTAATTGTVTMYDDPDTVRSQLNKQIDALKKLDDALLADIKVYTAVAAQTPVWASEYEQLADAIKRDEKIVEDIGSRLEREKVELQAAQRITPFQDAALMKKDIKKQVLATAVAPLAIMLAVCMGLAFLEPRKGKVRSAGEISLGLGIRVVGAVPRMPHLERHIAGPAGESDLEGTPVMESIDAIRTRLLYEADARSMRLVMVT